ncbi:hypothetical protein [Mycobacterium sp. PSTR-4-N]|uniref:hypothetical protein n=1 Tax=Mycobacterium sp. PSTR-4-N TaxID=2917745 RepID=UPI001F1559C7|nr:hypothetical protein [Mycobacterium sp. PSTR-4-N]MCG7596303.1 hypothetical protein [Mycobacterium sp. PSTR-4-N]
MTARRYTQAQVADIFAKAEASADSLPAENWDAYVLGYVSAALGVKLARFEADLEAALR